MLEYLGFGFLALGTLFFLISAIGLLRMPDIYTRMHVGTKSTTIATLLIITGGCFLEPAWSLKLLLIAVFILLTNPLSSSVIARAAHKDAQKINLDQYKEQE
jgi:multicomponent Na+:H+ antiporter subunit G